MEGGRSDFLAYSLGDVRLNPEYPSKYSLLNLASQSDHVLPLTITVGDVAKMMIKVWRCLGAATRSSSERNGSISLFEGLVNTSAR